MRIIENLGFLALIFKFSFRGHYGDSLEQSRFVPS